MNTQNIALGRVNYTAIIVILAMLTAFAPFATDTYLPGFPEIAKSLNTSTPSLQLSLSIFFLGLAIGQLFYGPLTDRWGRKLPLLAGIGIFTVSSVLIVFATNLEQFVALRFLQAIGGCSGMVISRIIIQDLFDQKRSAQALSTMMVIQGIGPVLAPVSGGFILSHYSWQYVFVALTMFSVLCFFMAMHYIPETLSPSELKKQSTGQVLTSFYQLIKEKSFIIPCLIGSLAVSVIFTFIAASPELFMNTYQLDKAHYGLVFGSVALGVTVFSQINSFLLKRFSPAKILGAAVAAGVIFAIALLFSFSVNSLTLTMLPLILCIGMMPLAAANSTAMAMSAFPEKAGTASSLVGVIQFGLGFICSTLPGLFGDQSTLAMGVVILACFGLSFLLFLYHNKQSRSMVTGISA